MSLLQQLALMLNLGWSQPSVHLISSLQRAKTSPAAPLQVFFALGKKCYPDLSGESDRGKRGKKAEDHSWHTHLPSHQPIPRPSTPSRVPVQTGSSEAASWGRTEGATPTSLGRPAYSELGGLVRFSENRPRPLTRLQIKPCLPTPASHEQTATVNVPAAGWVESPSCGQGLPDAWKPIPVPLSEEC